jgi:hypothetical protein
MEQSTVKIEIAYLCKYQRCMGSGAKEEEVSFVDRSHPP